MHSHYDEKDEKHQKVLLLVESCSSSVLNIYCRLHILDEIEETVSVLMNVSGDNSGSSIGRQDLSSHWQTRLKMMQVCVELITPNTCLFFLC